ncbi:MAG: transporter substrate-binding domain-containing protein [Pseudomonadota bacterium]
MATWMRMAFWLCAALATPAAMGAAPDPIRVATSHLPPYSMETANGPPGALYELVTEMLHRTGLPAKIEFVPWQRAIHLSTSQTRSAIFPLTRSPEREYQYRWLARLYHEHFLFLSLKGGKFDVRQPALGKERRIGILRGSLIGKTLREAGYRHIVEASSVDESLRFLRRGIVDAVCGERNIFLKAHQGSAASAYRMSEPLRTTTTWLGGSLDFSEADAALFQKAMKDMIEDGSYDQILKKYSLDRGP